MADTDGEIITLVSRQKEPTRPPWMKLSLRGQRPQTSRRLNRSSTN